MGLDISPIASWHVPPNVRFIVDDIDLEEWSRQTLAPPFWLNQTRPDSRYAVHGSNFDFMHTRMVLTHLQRPIQLAKTIFEYAKPEIDDSRGAMLTSKTAIYARAAGWSSKKCTHGPTATTTRCRPTIA